MSDYEIECEECGWAGVSAELHCSDDDFKSGKSSEVISFNLCPDCGSESIVDLEEEDE